MKLLKLDHLLWRHINLFGHKGVNDGQNSISGYVLELETQKFAFQLISGWGIQKWSQFFDILEIWPPAVTLHYLIWA